MKSSTLRSEHYKDESLKPIKISVSVIGLSGSCKIKGAVGVGKSSLCNRLVRPDHFNQKQISTLSLVDYHSDVINGSSWIYWDNFTETIDSKVYVFHVIEQTVLINDQTFLPFDNDSESDYVSRAVSDRVTGTKRAFLSPSQFSRCQGYDAASTTEQQSTIDAFILVFDVSEVNARDYQCQDRYVAKLLTALHKAKKPTVIALTKFDVKCQKIKSRFDSIIEKQNLKSIPVIETSASLNINISQLPSIVISEINHSHRPLLLAKKSHKIVSFEDALASRNLQKIDYLVRFRHIVNVEVAKTYDISWETFSSNNDLSMFSGLIDKAELSSEFGCCKAALIDKIKESLMSMYLVLFKKTLFEFIPQILCQESSNSQVVLESLLQNTSFLQRFQTEDIDESNVFLTAHLQKKIDFPLPRFLININHQLNRLYLIDKYIEEIKFQRIERNFADEFLRRLESNGEVYEDMSFSEIENCLRDLPMLAHFRDLASTIFSTFIDNRVSQFKVVFDEKLLELSFMIFMCAPVKTCMKKCSIKEKDYKDTLPDMDLINSINNKIYFDHKRYEKKVYRKQRTSWVVRFIGSLVSSNPRECYHFDFNTAMCQKKLLEYLKPFRAFVLEVVVVISFDVIIDEFWKHVVDDKTNANDEQFSNSIGFISFTDLSDDNFWNHRFNACQKLIILFKENQKDVEEIMDRIFNKHIIYHDQMSFITVENGSIECDFHQNLVVSRVNDQCNNIDDNVGFDPSLMAVIKAQTVFYTQQREPINIWFIVLCDDTYDRSIPAMFFLSFFDDCIVLDERHDSSMASVSLLYIPEGEDAPQRVNLTVVSYHQAFKLLNDKFQEFTIHLLMFFCDLNRLASVNTLFAVLKNLLAVVNGKFVICPIKSADFLDNDEFVNRKKMVKTLAFDSRTLCVIIENGNGIDGWFAPDVDNVCQLRSMIAECVHSVNDVDDHRNVCKYNTAYETEDLATVATSSNIANGHRSTEFYKDKVGKCCPGENGCQSSSFGSHERTFSQSDSLVSPDVTSSDHYFSQDQTDSIVNLSRVEYVESEALGCFNEHLFCPIEEENNLSVDVQDSTTIVIVNCTNRKHIACQSNLSGVPVSSKFRSFSGPVQANKSFTRKYSTAQNPFNRSQRYSSKKSQSLTTSPVTSYMKSFGHNRIIGCQCKGSNEHCLACPAAAIAAVHGLSNTSSKGIKSAISRLFSSDRGNSNKSAEERRSIFRSFKFPKKNTEKRNKNNAITNTSSEGQFGVYHHSVSSFAIPPSHSTPVSVADTRHRTKSLSKTVFSL